MGLLREHKLTDYIDRYNLKYYFETGTGKAECLEYALRYPFEEYWTVDIDEDLIEESFNKFKNMSKNINLLIGKSTEILDEYVPQIPKESPTRIISQYLSAICAIFFEYAVKQTKGVFFFLNKIFLIFFLCIFRN